ncbi:MAG: Rpn family recombination-promoting nuclease/putative transposase [Haliscomenobacter sp.]|nr:Rpn family recombination-promoting nuclease/putative transposase [Haliscomenobacter sp.]
MMPKEIRPPHDAFMKSLLSDIDIARDFLKTFLPERLQALLDFQSLKAEQTTFVTPELSDTLAQTTGGNLLKEVIVYMVSITKIPARQWAEMVKALPAAIKEEVMSTYDMILQEGIQKGIEQGLQKGIEQGIQKGIQKGIEQGLQKGKEKKVNEVVLRGYQNGVSFEILCLLTGLGEEEVKAIIAQHGVEEDKG